MAERTVYCEECVEDIPASEVFWDDGRLYCRRCGSELEPPDRDIFEEIVDNRTGFLFRDEEPPEDDEVANEAEALHVEPGPAETKPAVSEDEDAEADERDERP